MPVTVGHIVVLVCLAVLLLAWMFARDRTPDADCNGEEASLATMHGKEGHWNEVTCPDEEAIRTGVRPEAMIDEEPADD